MSRPPGCNGCNGCNVKPKCAPERRSPGSRVSATLLLPTPLETSVRTRRAHRTCHLSDLLPLPASPADPGLGTRVLRHVRRAAQVESLLLRSHVPVYHGGSLFHQHHRGRARQELLGRRAQPAELNLLASGQRTLRYRPHARTLARSQRLVARDARRHHGLPQLRGHAVCLPHRLRRRAQSVLLPGRNRTD